MLHVKSVVVVGGGRKKRAINRRCVLPRENQKEGGEAGQGRKRSQAQVSFQDESQFQPNPAGED